MNSKNQTARLTELIQPGYPTGRVVILETGEFAIQSGMLWPQWKNWEAWQQHLVVGRTYAEAKLEIERLLK